MGKIRVQDLARMLHMEDQDLMFKLRSIGVRVEGQDAQVDTDVLKAVLEGKKLATPREVIVRDEESAAAPARPTPPPRRMPPGPPGRRPPGPPPRPRPRTTIHKVEPRIPTLPTRERPAETRAKSEPAAPQRAERGVPPPPRPPATAEPQLEAAAAAPVTEAEEGKKRAREERKPAAKEKPAKGKPRVGEVEEEDLRALRGKIDEDEIDEVASVASAAAARRQRRAHRREAEATGTVTPSQAAAEAGPVTIVEGITVRDLAEKTGVKSKDLIKRLFERGMMVTINHVLDTTLAAELAQHLGFETLVVSFEEEVQLKQEAQLEKARSEGKAPRAPVVTIMGHVDHGKTTLLDAIRESRLVEAEHGGITQHIGAYEVTKNGRKLVFLDTPGHEAFTQLRARGGRAADLVVLVVAADDGVMPQTIEAIDHARAAKASIVVAINKVDKANANTDRVKKELSERGLTPEDWGGDTVTVPLSALKREGIPELLEMILLTSELLELRASPDMPAQGVVLEARKETGRGIVATVLVQDGTLSVGDVYVSGATWGRVRSMLNDRGERISEAGPATPVEVTGFQDIPGAGDPFQVVQDESRGRTIADFRQQEQRRRELAPAQGRISLEQLFDKIEQGEVKELPVVLKADVQGSVEVLQDTLAKLSTEKVKVNVLHGGVGAITTNDVLLASASGAIIIGFNVRPERIAADLAEKEGVEIRLHTIIYELTDELKKAMAGLLEPVYEEVTKGRAEVRDTFKIPRVGTIAGCHVVEGTVPRNAAARLLRDNVVVYEGKIASLRRFKEDVSEVRTGFDCGIGLDRFQDVKPGDLIEAYVREAVAPTL
ncbi:MAG TPA: translation initiation factor IF-2 [Thermoanaerobaculia bacterium]|nr:translation initiation factor IF-2 [Thermoanaerobaculia bacterium]